MERPSPVLPDSEPGPIPPQRPGGLSWTSRVVIGVVIVVVIVAGALAVEAFHLFEGSSLGSSHVQFPPGNWSLDTSTNVSSGALASGSLPFQIGRSTTNFLVVYWMNGTSITLTLTSPTETDWDGTGFSASPSMADAGALTRAAEGNFGSSLSGGWLLSWQETGADLHVAIYTR
jgi:hypothetical protein